MTYLQDIIKHSYYEDTVYEDIVIMKIKFFDNHYSRGSNYRLNYGQIRLASFILELEHKVLFNFINKEFFLFTQERKNYLTGRYVSYQKEIF